MEKQLTHLYVIVNKTNGKKYFGITSQNPATKRWVGHKTVAKRKVRRTPLIFAMNKYGHENFIFKVLVSHENLPYIAELEKKCIKEHKTQDGRFGYNLADGGEINIGFKIPKDIIERQKARMIGEGNHFYGRTHSEETRMKISMANKGRKLPEEVKAKMKGRPSWLKGVTGENHPNFGVKRPEEIKKNIQMNMPHRIEIIMIDPSTGEEIMKFLSKKSAGKWLSDNGVCASKNLRSIASTITRAINNDSISYGYKWIEADERESTIETALYAME